MRKRSEISLCLPVLISILVVSLYYLQAGFIEALEVKTYDFRFRLRGPQPPDEKVAVIAVDEHSISELGRFPWSRVNYAKLIDFLAKAKAKAVVFDIFFPEAESTEVDRRLASSVRRSGMTVLAAAMMVNEDGTVEEVIDNIPELNTAAKIVAHMNVAPDDDGVLRWTPLLLSYGEKTYPSIALAGANLALGAGEIAVSGGGISLGGRTVPSDSRKWMLIDHSGPPGIYKRYSFSDVLKGRIAPSEFKDKILLVGVTAIGVYDLRVTPFSNNTPGVEINANVIDNILNGNFIRRGPFEALTDMLFIVLLGIAGFLAATRLRAETALPFIAMLLAAYCGFAYFLFLKGHWISIVYPAISVSLTFPAATALRFVLVEKKAKEIKAMFSSYVSKKVVDELVKHPEKARVGGELKTVTVLFSDVKGFTTFSEKHKPGEVVETLNQYLSAMTDEIMKHDGTLDKFLGDGILAIWGAPLEQENHPELAVRCAVQMCKRLKSLHAKWGAEGKELLTFGVGIHTGEAIVGNIGARDKKVEYTAIGDTVNLASRIQGISRTANRTIIITDSLYQHVKTMSLVEPLGPVTVKGRAAAVNVYALTGLKDEHGEIKMIS